MCVTNAGFGCTAPRVVGGLELGRRVFAEVQSMVGVRGDRLVYVVGGDAANLAACAFFFGVLL